MGRLVRDPDIRTSQSGQKVARYTLAVSRQYKREGEPDADFINCITFGNRAEFAEKYLQKGRQIAVVGRIQTGSYEKDGHKVYTFDVVVDSHYFADQRTAETASSGSHSRPQPRVQQPTAEDFAEIDQEEGLPF